MAGNEATPRSTTPAPRGSRSRTTWRSEALGPRREVTLARGTLPYHETGSGPTLVFVHGALVNANHWRRVVERLSAKFRCITLDLPLGAHTEPLPPTTDLSAPALADWIADAVEAVAEGQVTLIGNNTGGALCQVLVARRPERVGRLVLTSCDAFDNFPPKAMRPAMPLLKLPGALPVLFAPLRLAAARRRFMTLIRATKRPVPLEVMDSYVFPALESAGVRGDVRRLLQAVDTRYTLEAAEALRGFDRPALIAWSREDSFFPSAHAGRLADLLPDATLEWVEDSRTFSPEDQPGRLAELIGAFARAGAATEAPTG